MNLSDDSLSEDTLVDDENASDTSSGITKTNRESFELQKQSDLDELQHRDAEKNMTIANDCSQTDFQSDKNNSVTLNLMVRKSKANTVKSYAYCYFDSPASDHDWYV